jgi:dihydrolipoamide dehydrogenase
MAEKLDVILLGMGPGGEAAAGRLIKGGKKVAVVEKEYDRDTCKIRPLGYFVLQKLDFC